MSKTPLSVVWFKRDLRPHDHPALFAASRSGAPILPLYIVEPELWAEPDMSARHWAFIAESLEEVRARLASLGQPLVVRVGDALDVLRDIHQSHGISELWSHQETGTLWTYRRDLAVGAWCREARIPWHEPRQSGVIRRIKTRNGWAKQWDSFMAEPQLDAPDLRSVSGMEPGAIPTSVDLNLRPDPCPDRQIGGRSEGLKTLDTFLSLRAGPYRKAMSSPLAGAKHCSRLSPHLAWGTLSMKEVTQATWTRQRDLKQNGEPSAGWRSSMVSFSGRLHWRDHFGQKLEDAPDMEIEPLHSGYRGMRPSEPDAARLKAWAEGETGLPFLDACMRSLKATGWLNFRMRAMVMCCASYHLWLPWQETGKVLARYFTDYDPGIHWPQTQMQSGTTGINTIRIYNPIKQGHDQDPTGAFVRKWCHELADVPAEFLQEPWLWEEASSVLGKTYPEPIVDSKAAAKAAKDKVYERRRSSAFREEADAIQMKHGSRKSGLPMIGQRKSRRTTKSSPSGDDQMKLL